MSSSFLGAAHYGVDKFPTIGSSGVEEFGVAGGGRGMYGGGGAVLDGCRVADYYQQRLDGSGCGNGRGAVSGGGGAFGGGCRYELQRNTAAATVVYGVTDAATGDGYGGSRCRDYLQQQTGGGRHHDFARNVAPTADDIHDDLRFSSVHPADVRGGGGEEHHQQHGELLAHRGQHHNHQQHILMQHSQRVGGFGDLQHQQQQQQHPGHLNPFQELNDAIGLHHVYHGGSPPDLMSDGRCSPDTDDDSSSPGSGSGGGLISPFSCGDGGYGGGGGVSRDLTGQLPVIYPWMKMVHAGSG